LAPEENGKVLSGRAYRTHPPSIPKSKLVEIFRIIDDNGSGTLNLQEFSKAFEHLWDSDEGPSYFGGISREEVENALADAFVAGGRQKSEISVFEFQSAVRELQIRRYY
jgi:hypothetical protein